MLRVSFLFPLPQKAAGWVTPNEWRKATFALLHSFIWLVLCNQAVTLPFDLDFLHSFIWLVLCNQAVTLPFDLDFLRSFIWLVLCNHVGF